MAAAPVAVGLVLAAAEVATPVPGWVAQLASVLGGALTIALLALGRALWKRVDTMLDGLAAVREQTENDHADAPYPNLREELTATREAIEATTTVLTEHITDSAAWRTAIEQEIYRARPWWRR